MLTTLVLLAAILSADDMEGVTTPTETLKNLALDANSECRGRYPQDAEMFAGCAARDVYFEILEYRNVCYDGPSVAEYDWMACDKSQPQR